MFAIFGFFILKVLKYSINPFWSKGRSLFSTTKYDAFFRSSVASLGRMYFTVFLPNFKYL